MEVEPRYWQRPETLQDIYVRSTSGAQVPLSAFTRFQPSSDTLAVNHQGQFPAVTLSFNLAPGVALGDAVRAIEQSMRELGLPASVRGSFQGTAQAFQASLVEPAAADPRRAGDGVYRARHSLRELRPSDHDPVDAAVGGGGRASLALLLFQTELTVIAMIGIILLIGIVKKNAIMMIDFALVVERTQGKSSRDAIYEACLMRFRPIMMTTMAAMLGALPLAVGGGVGSELRRPLGIAIVGGLIVSQMLTLYTTPVVYLYLDRFRLWVARMRGGHKESHAAALSNVFPPLKKGG